eukprot:3456176-Pleurochrysis_carterae.AAC.1
MYKYLGTIIIQISFDNPPNGSLATLCSGLRCWKDIRDIPRDPIGCIRSAATFYLVPLPQ